MIVSEGPISHYYSVSLFQRNQNMRPWANYLFLDLNVSYLFVSSYPQVFPFLVGGLEIRLTL